MVSHGDDHQESSNTANYKSYLYGTSRSLDPNLRKQRDYEKKCSGSLPAPDISVKREFCYRQIGVSFATDTQETVLLPTDRGEFCYREQGDSFGTDRQTKESFAKTDRRELCYK